MALAERERNFALAWTAVEQTLIDAARLIDEPARSGVVSFAALIRKSVESELPDEVIAELHKIRNQLR